MKKSLIYFAAVLTLAAVCVSLWMPAVPASAAAVTDSHITVTGYGAISVKPDIAYMNIGVQTTGTEAAACYTENAAKINAVIAAVENAGVKEDDIQTAAHSIYANYDYTTPMHKQTGYTANCMLNIKVTDLKIISDVYSKAVAAGANAGNSLQFGLSDNSAAQNDAIVKAAENAKAKAAAIAQSMNVTLGAPIEITENNFFDNRMYSAFSDAADLKANIKETIRAGEIKVEAQVRIKYSIS